MSFFSPKVRFLNRNLKPSFDLSEECFIFLSKKIGPSFKDPLAELNRATSVYKLLKFLFLCPNENNSSFSPMGNKTCFGSQRPKLGGHPQKQNKQIAQFGVKLKSEAICLGRIISFMRKY